MVIGIIGAGASGMAAAIRASQNPQNQILLFERQARVGRKLQATGNGRCNLTNLHADPSHYHGAEPLFCAPALERFSVRKTLSWFSSMGLFTTVEDSGRVYPYSDQANSVVDILRFALEKPNISLISGFEVSRVQVCPQGFLIRGSQDYPCDKLIVACGGLAGTKLGGSISGYQILRSLGHKMTRLRPSLVQLKTRWDGNTSLKGVRANCKAEILRGGAPFAESTGEIQFTEYGISGPVIFEISRDVCEGPGPWECRLDLLPEVTEEALYSALTKKSTGNLTCENLLTGILHNRLGRVLCQQAGLNPHVPIHSLSEGSLHTVCRLVKDLTIPLTEPLGMDSAQVTAGGMVTSQFDSNTMESRLLPGLYACGEVLDIDGDCGGFNLQWAWSSGNLAGASAGGTNL